MCFTTSIGREQLINPVCHRTLTTSSDTAIVRTTTESPNDRNDRGAYFRFFAPLSYTPPSHPNRRRMVH